MRTVIVTGASGFAGGHLLDLLAGDPDVRLIGWRGPGPGEAPLRLPRDAIWRDVDVLDRAAVEAAVEADAPDEVYHLAGAAQVAQSWDRVATTLAVNVMGTHRLLEALRGLTPRARVLLTCSGLVYRPSPAPLDEDAPLGPSTPYGTSKLAQEQLGLRACHDDGQAVIVARAFNHVGPGQAPHFFASSFACQIAEIEAGAAPPVIHVGNLEARRDLTDVRDTVRAYRALMGAGVPGTPYNVCSGRMYRVGDTLQALIGLAKVEVDVRVDPSRLRPSDNPIVLGDPGRLKSATGWAPTIPMARTLGDLLAYWRERIAAG